jgi:NOL1/NOP2/fmu family ribosome biogenesis protein
LGYLEERFGIPERIFDDYLLLKRSKSWSLMKKMAEDHPVGQLKVSKVGLKAFQRVGAYVKPTTRLIQAFGHRANKAILEIDEKQLKSLVEGETLLRDLHLEKGYVILRLEKDFVLGLGFYAQGTVRSQLPRQDLRKAMVLVS